MWSGWLIVEPLQPSELQHYHLVPPLSSVLAVGPTVHVHVYHPKPVGLYPLSLSVLPLYDS